MSAANHEHSGTVFALVGGTAVDSITGVLGIWQFVSATDAIAFNPHSAAQDEAPIWRADFPADVTLAAQHLAHAQQGLAASQQALDSAEQQLAVFSDQLQRAPAADLSFSGAPPDQATSELMGLLNELQEHKRSVSYGLRDTLSQRWVEATQQFQALLNQVLLHVVHYAWVETRIQGRLVGQTLVGWSGDVDTIWQSGLGPAQIVLHQQTLALTLASRSMLLKTTATIMHGAAELSKLAVFLSTPGGVILALPAAWRFVNLALAETVKHQKHMTEVNNDE